MPTFDEGDSKRQPPAWEPEPLHLPLHLPVEPKRTPEHRKRDDEASDVESSGVVIIDLC